MSDLVTRLNKAAREVPWLHVMPVHDTAPHTPSRECPCGPTPDREEPSVWVHHADDMREETRQ